MVTIPRDKLGGIASCRRLHAGGSDLRTSEIVMIPRDKLGGIFELHYETFARTRLAASIV